MNFVFNPRPSSTTYVEVALRGGRLYVTDERGVLVESNDWAWFNGLWRAQRDRAADGRSQ
jgi:hypothetical protein